MKQHVVGTADNWLRINLIGELCLKEALIGVLHNRMNDPSYQGLPENEV